MRATVFQTRITCTTRSCSRPELTTHWAAPAARPAPPTPSAAFSAAIASQPAAGRPLGLGPVLRARGQKGQCRASAEGAGEGHPAAGTQQPEGAAASLLPQAQPAPAPASVPPASSVAPRAPAPASSPPPAAPSTGSSFTRQLERLKVSLLAALSSLDRGLAANAREAAEVDQLCNRLEALGGPVTLEPLTALGKGSATSSAPLASGATPAGGAGDGAGTDLLAGTWRLVYSSGFNSGSLGGRRPGPPAALFPTALGQVYQRIEPGTAKLDNIVELLLNYGPPDLELGPELLGGIARGAVALGLDQPVRELVSAAERSAGLRPEALPQPLQQLLDAAEGKEPGAPVGSGIRRRESPAARLTLRHDYEVTLPATVRIVYEETYGELVGSDLFAQLPRLAAPSLPEPLRPPRFLRSAAFQVTYLDASMRITRGDRGELRVYLRDDEGGRAAGLGLAGTPEGAAAAALDYID